MTTIKGNLNVDKAVTLDTTLDVTGDTSVTTFDSTGATSLATNGGAVNIASSGYMTTIKGNLNVDKAVTLDNNLTVSGILTVDGVSRAHVPRGVILMWYGTTSNIPSGWAICDGNQNTPDLRDRFIVGAGNSYTSQQTGGATQVTLQISELPSHSHYIDSEVNQGGSHSHEVEGNTNEKSVPHSHNIVHNELNAQVTWQQYPGNGVGIMVDTNYPPSGSTEGSRALKIAGHTQSNSIKHNHYINLDTEPGGSHNHEIKTNTNNSGGGNSHENLPPYYALYYIMKL